MTLVLQPWFLAMVSVTITVGSYVLALIFVGLNRKRAPKAACYLFWAIGLLLAGWLTRTIGLAFLAQVYSPAVFGQVARWAASIQTILAAIALWLFVKAAFTTESPRNPASEDFLPGDRQSAVGDENPFVPPR